jgi:rubrerythrin
VMLLFYPYGNDYIKYLNDEGSHGHTYEQWKNKNSKQYSVKCKQCGSGKDRYQPCPKCNY